MKVREYIRSLGFGGLLSGGLAGLFFLFYPNLLPANFKLESVLLISSLLGAAVQRLMNTLILKPLSYYAKIGQLILLRRLIGKTIQKEIIQALTIKYFLGESSEGRVLSFPIDVRKGLPQKKKPHHQDSSIQGSNYPLH
jgi:hypothetical protein